MCGAVALTATDTVILTGVANSGRVTVSLDNVTDNNGQTLPSTPFAVGSLVGDTNNSNGVTATDVGQTKAASGQALSASNFRLDVNTSGSINATDVGAIKAASGTFVP